MSALPDYIAPLNDHFKNEISDIWIAHDEITLEVQPLHLKSVCLALRDEPSFQFATLLDICGVDYLDYGRSEWLTTEATAIGFERGVRAYAEQISVNNWKKPRFAVVYHLLSLTHNVRLRIRTFVETDPNTDSDIVKLIPIDSVTDIWPSADWYEREAFDLYGIEFQGHPNLRRILTDYEFTDHPLRKDFPLIGKSEVRYDAVQASVIYEPVTSVIPRTLVPKVIRHTSTDKSQTKPHSTDSTPSTASLL